MYKKLILSLTALILIGVAGNAFSVNTYTMVGGNGSTVEKTTFAWNETPWIWIVLDLAVNEDHMHLDLEDPAASDWFG